jgi:predicted Zn-dependent peptidase
MVEKTILDCGLTIISEFRPELPSFALSFTLKSGSRTETTHINGIHHLIEHMLFKGTEKYDLRMIAQISDRLGGSLNAFTGKEITQIYLKVIDEKIQSAFNLLSEVVLKPTFPDGEFYKEKNVVLQEIKEADDNPETVAFETFFKKLFENNALGSPISGTEDQVTLFDRDGVFAYYQNKYLPENLILAAAGNIDHYSFVELARQYFSGYRKKIPSGFSFQKSDLNLGTFIKKNQNLNQVYVILGFQGIAKGSPLRYKFLLLNEILGSGMSSRLFQKIREEKGLAYTISSFLDGYKESGVHIIYSIIEPAKIMEYLQAVQEEILNLKKRGIDKEELERAKDHLKSSIILGLEDNGAKMRFNVNQELYLEREIKLNEIIENINGVGCDDIKILLDTFLDIEETAILFYGNIDEGKYENFRFGG